MPIVGANVTIAAGATTFSISGSWTTPYQPGFETSWATDVVPTTVTGSTLAGAFTVPCPAGGGTLYYTVLTASTVGGAGGTVTLTAYLGDLRLLLRDENDDYWSQANKTTFLSRALTRRDLDTGQNRVLVTYTLVAGTALYPFSTVGNASVFDVVGIAILDGSQRIQLNRHSYSELSIVARQWTNYQSRPLAFCRYAPNQVYLAPTPQSAYSSEWDCCVFSDPLVNGTDVDPLPYPYTAPVPYYAAYLAKLYERNQEEAAYFLALYKEHVDIALNSRVGYSPSAYSGVVRV